MRLLGEVSVDAIDDTAVEFVDADDVAIISINATGAVMLPLVLLLLLNTVTSAYNNCKIGRNENGKKEPKTASSSQH